MHEESGYNIQRKDMEIALKTNVVSCSIGVVASISVSHTEGPRFDPWIEHFFEEVQYNPISRKALFFDIPCNEV